MSIATVPLVVVVIALRTALSLIHLSSRPATYFAKSAGQSGAVADDMTDGPLFMTYIPRLVFRDLAGITDPHRTDALRERDQELFAKHGMFCRRAVPGEFTAEALSRLDRNGFVVVSFARDKWHRQPGRRRPATLIQPRRGGER